MEKIDSIWKNLLGSIWPDILIAPCKDSDYDLMQLSCTWLTSDLGHCVGVSKYRSASDIVEIDATNLPPSLLSQCTMQNKVKKHS